MRYDGVLVTRRISTTQLRALQKIVNKIGGPLPSRFFAHGKQLGVMVDSIHQEFEESYPASRLILKVKPVNISGTHNFTRDELMTIGVVEWHVEDMFLTLNAIYYDGHYDLPTGDTSAYMILVAEIYEN